MLEGPLQYCAASKCLLFFPQFLYHAAWPAPAISSRSLGYFLFLPQGSRKGEGEGWGCPWRSWCGHSREGGGDCHPGAAHSTWVKELQEVGAVGLDALGHRRALNLGNLLAGWDFKAGTAAALPLTRPEVWFYTHPSPASSSWGCAQGLSPLGWHGWALSPAPGALTHSTPPILDPSNERTWPFTKPAKFSVDKTPERLPENRECSQDWWTERHQAHMAPPNHSGSEQRCRRDVPMCQREPWSWDPSPQS